VCVAGRGVVDAGRVWRGDRRPRCESGMSRPHVTTAYCPGRAGRLLSRTGCVGGELEPCENAAPRRSSAHRPTLRSRSFRQCRQWQARVLSGARRSGSAPYRSSGGRVLARHSTLHSLSGEPLRPFDPQDSGWADLVRTEMDSWFPERLPVHFHRSKRSTARSAVSSRAPFAVLGGVFALAAAIAFLGGLGKRRRRTDVRSLGSRAWPLGRRGISPRNWGGG
jgi:hypothetical protein